MRLLYNSPAKNWMESLPLGNGNIGLMLDGGVADEKIYLNDDTLWSGYPKSHHNKKSAKNLSKIRQLIFDGEIGKAEKLIKQTSLGDWSESYEPLGTLEIKYENFNQYIDYIRTLDLKNGIHCSSFKANGNFVEKESFCSYPDKIAAIKISAEKPIDFSVSASSKLKYNIISKANELFICGNAPDKSTPNYCHLAVWPVRYNEKKAMAFCAGIKIVTDGKIIAQKTLSKFPKASQRCFIFQLQLALTALIKCLKTAAKK